MTYRVQLDIIARDGAARTGTAITANGTYRTPCFMPVGTRGAVKYLSAADYEALGVAPGRLFRAAKIGERREGVNEQ